MRILNVNINKFSFGQLTSNSDGKTSASGTAGLYIIFIGGICFLMGCIERMFIDQSIDVITQSIVFVGIGAGLLGYRKSIWVKSEKTEGTPETPATPTTSSENTDQLLKS